VNGLSDIKNRMGIINNQIKPEQFIFR